MSNGKPAADAKLGEPQSELAAALDDLSDLSTLLRVLSSACEDIPADALLVIAKAHDAAIRRALLAHLGLPR